MAAMQRFGTLLLAIGTFFVFTMAGAAGSGVLAALLDSAGVVLSEQVYLALSVSLGLLASGHVLGVFE